MAKLKVGDIIIENGNISFGNQTSFESHTVTHQDNGVVQSTSYSNVQNSSSVMHSSYTPPNAPIHPAYGQNPYTPQPQLANNQTSPQELALKAKGNSSTYVGLGAGGILCGAGIGAAAWIFGLSWLPIIAIPFVAGGALSIWVGVTKKTTLVQQANENKQKAIEQKDKHKQKIFDLLNDKSTEWTFEQIEQQSKIPTNELLLSLKGLMEDGSLVEELNTDTGDWFYMLSKKAEAGQKPQTIEERLSQIKD